MKLKMNKFTNFLLCGVASVSMLGVTGCSKESVDDPTPTPPPTSGQNPPPTSGGGNNGGNNGGGTTSKTPSNDMSKLWIGNITVAGAKGNNVESLKIMRTKASTFYGNENHRAEADLGNTVILSISGGTYYTDGDHPTADADIYSVYSKLEDKKHPNVTIGMTIANVSEEEANAYLTIESAVGIETNGFILNGDNYARKLTGGSIKITAKEGFDFDGHTEFEFNRADIQETEFNNLIFGPGSDAGIDLDFEYADFLREFSEQGNTIPVKVIEVATDDQNNNRKRILPLLSKVLID